MFERPSESASAMANHVFGAPLTWAAYIPNTRLHQLREKVISVGVAGKQEELMHLHCAAWERAFCQSILSELLFPIVPPFRHDGSELNANIPNLHQVLSLIVRFIKGEKADMVHLEAKAKNFIAFEDILCLASVAKGHQDSSVVPRPESLSLGTDIALELLRCGVPAADCAVPIITSFGYANFQILGVYFMEPSFPVMTRLSHSIDIRDDDDGDELLRWIFCLASFVEETGRIARACKEVTAVTNNIVLRLDDKFFKPIYGWMKDEGHGSQFCSKMRVDTLLQLYQSIAEVKRSEKYILFPVGLMMLPKKDNEIYKEHRSNLIRSMNRFGFERFPADTPMIVFPLLSEEYTYERPPKVLVAKYLDAIKSAIRVLNEAEVCHGDLRPRNILWRQNGNDGVDIKIIDFEDSGWFGRPIEFYRDSRFPHSDQPEGSFMLASAVHNEWFYTLISSWLSNTKRDTDFDEHMRSDDNAESCTELLRADLEACVLEIN